MYEERKKVQRKKEHLTLQCLLRLIYHFFFRNKRTNNTIFHVTRGEKYCVWQYLTSQNFGKPKTDNMIFYIAISAAKNICIEQKIFCTVTPPSISFRIALSFFRNRQFNGSRFFYLKYSECLCEFLQRNKVYICV